MFQHRRRESVSDPDGTQTGSAGTSGKAEGFPAMRTEEKRAVETPIMCGRYTLHIPPAELVDHFGVTGPVPNLPARSGTARCCSAPTQTAPVVR
ncbi:MAG TPA: hypothetical protein VEH84_07585, partial [Alphaproteobacteria bacterium]|nr:hypothetical protein [Alphaproteobacteria bacterium]